MKLVFVILNYGTFLETDECIQSIIRHIDLPESEYAIVVVDNGSPDNSLTRIHGKYDDYSIVDIISTGKNLGFARGNNFGIAFANKNYSPEFVVVLNSDTELFQDDLYQKISQEYQNSQFGLLGPMMCISSGRCDDSPWEPVKLEAVKKRLAEYKAQKRSIENRTIYFSMAFEKIKRFVSGSRQSDPFHTHTDFWKYQTGVELQGAFLVFSRKVFDYIDGFDDRTFLYYEEQLLFINVSKSGMPIVYDPRISVYHKDGRSTHKLSIASRKKLLFLTQCNIESLGILLEELESREVHNGTD